MATKEHLMLTRGTFFIRKLFCHFGQDFERNVEKDQNRSIERHTVIYFKLNAITKIKDKRAYFLSSTKATTPAANGADADVPLNSSVHL